MSDPSSSPVLSSSSGASVPPPTAEQMMAEINRLHALEKQGQFERATLQRQLLAAQDAAQRTAAASAAQGQAPSKLVGIKLPHPDKFKGEIGSDCERWIRSLERQFEFVGVGVDDPRRVQVAVLHFSDNAELWWENLGSSGRATASLTWAVFVDTLLHRFRPVLQAEFARNRLFAVKQTHSETVSSVVQRFLRELGPIEQEMHPKDQVHHFRVALKDRRIVYKLHEAKPSSLAEAIQVATSWEAQFASAGALVQAGAPFTMRSGTSSSFVPRASSSSSSSGSMPMEISQMEQAMFEENEASEHAASTSVGAREPTPSDWMKQMVDMQKSFLAVMSTQRSNHSNNGNRGGDNKKKSYVQGLDSTVVQDRLRKGLCIKCGEKGHMKKECPNSLKL